MDKSDEKPVLNTATKPEEIPAPSSSDAAAQSTAAPTTAVVKPAASSTPPGQPASSLPVSENTEGDEGQHTGPSTELWDALTVGSLVLAPDLTRRGVPEGWWEAVITAINGDTYTVRLRDFPKEKPFKRKLHHLALLHPTAQ